MNKQINILSLVLLLSSVFIFLTRPAHGRTTNGAPSAYTVGTPLEDAEICLGDTIQLVVNTGASSYVWAPATGLSCVECEDPLVFPTVTTTYIIKGNNGTRDTVVVTVFSPPQIQSVQVSNPTDCNLPNGTIVVSASGQGALEYSIDGGNTWSGVGLFSALPEGNYSIVVRNANGTCFTEGPAVQLTAPLAPEIVDVVSQNPSLCDATDGAITISATGSGTGLEYSIDGGITWQSQNSFSQLGSGIYQVAVRNEDGSCEVLGSSVTISASASEADISDIFIAPPTTCDIADGLITILIANDDGNFEFSIDGGVTFQPGNNFSGLTEGIYNIFIRRTDGTCLITGGFVELVSPDRPEYYGVSVIDPSGCDALDGNITVLAFGFSTLEFSIDGGVTWQLSNNFPGLAAGVYDIAIRDDDGGCFTEGETVLLNGGVTPEITDVNFTNPSECGLSTGSISISANGAGPVEYSIDGGVTWSASSQFSGLNAGAYEILARNAGGDCETSYDQNPVLLQLVVDPPVIANLGLSQPACSQSNGSIAVNVTGGGSLEYSIDGGANFQSNNQFTNLAPGTYTVVVSEVGGNCADTTSATLINVSCVDTVQVIIPADTLTEYCLDASVFNFTGNLTGAGFCNQGNTATVFASSITQECVSLMPAAGFTGSSPDLICTVHCFNNSATQCDTTYISVIVQGQVICDDLFSSDTVSGNYFGNPTSFCVQTPLSSLQGYDLTFNGGPLTNPFNCNLEPTTAYSFSLLPGAGFSGPYTLTSWVVGGNTFDGFFNNANELLTLMNIFDPAGNWQINLQGSFIYGGDLSTQYGSMSITHVPSGVNTILSPNQQFIPTGFTVGLSFPGVNVLIATDPNTGCSDTLYIDATFDLPSLEVVELTTTVDSPTSQFCISGAELPGGVIVNLGYCVDPANGSAPLVNDTCVYYIPNSGFVGVDTFCLVVCDDSTPQEICDTTIFIVNVLPETDTVYLTIPGGETTLDSCLSNAVIELPGAITSSEICGINTDEITVGVNDNCLTFNVVNNFTGTTEVCVVHCSGAVCDTNIVFVTVGPNISCDEIFIEESVSQISVTAEGILCIPVPLSQVNSYTITLDGSLYQAFTPCNFGDLTVFNYSSLPTGPYFVESWTVNGNTFSGQVPDISALTDSMNIWDPAGGWINDLTTQTLQGGAAGSIYSNLIISQVSGGTFTLPVSVIQASLGSQMLVTGFGTHEIVVVAPDGCSDTLAFVLEQHFITTDTIFLTTPVNSTLNDICGNTNDLLGNLVSLNYCGLPANGGIAQTDSTCIAYVPNFDFVGTDEICVVLCDDNPNPVCDTFLFVIEVLPQTVVPVTDTIFILATDVVSFDTCLTAGVLQLAGNIVSGEVCGANASEVSLTVNGNCVSIDLDDDFTGTTTACVVHCDDSNPSVCDTTILVITFNGVVTPCPSIFNPDEVFISLNNDTGEICLPVPVTEINNFSVFIDGAPYIGGFTACDFDSAYIYFYGLVFGQGNLGPYTVSWQAYGNTFNATVGNMTELVGFLNDWDPNGDWMLDPSTFTIVSSNDLGIYGNLTITHISTGVISNLAPDFSGIPAGTNITLTGSGTHEVVLTNSVDGCSDTLTVNALDQVDIIDIVTVENVPSQVVCLDTSGLPGNFTGITICQSPLNGTIIISGNCFTFNPDNGFIGTDQGCVTVCDDLGNCDTTLLNITVNPLCSLFDLFPDGVQEFQVDDCAASATYCVPVTLDSLVNFGVLDNGFPYSGGLGACNGNFSQISLDTGFHEIIFVHLNTGCQDTLLADVICEPDSTGCGINALSPLSYSVDCDSTVQFCVSVALSDLQNFLIEDNGVPFNGTVGACDLNSQFVSVTLDTGLHVLVFTDTVKGCSDEFIVNVECQVFEDVTVDVEVEVGDSQTLCLEDFGFQLSQIDSVAGTCTGNGNTTFAFDGQTLCVTVNGEIEGLDTLCFEVFFADTSVFFNVNITVTDPCPAFIPADFIGGGVNCSLDSGWICLPVNLAELANKVISLDGVVYTQGFQPCDFDSIFTLNYSSLPNQGLLGPYTVVSWSINGNIVSGIFNTAQELTDLMNLWDPAGGWQLVVNPIDQTIAIVGGTPSGSYGTMTVVQDISQVQTDLGINSTFAPGGVAIYIPVGSFQLTVTDTVTQCSDQLTVELTCVDSEVVIDTVQVGASDTFCLDLSELIGTVDTVFNHCPDASGESVNFILTNNCVIYTGISPGVDSACVVVCDDTGVCDTTYFFITVELQADSLMAVNDTITISQGESTMIDVFGNDVIVSITQFFILDAPVHGTAVFLPDGSVNYVPEPGYCDDVMPDSFTYVICNPLACDTAIVFVTVQCSELEIFNAFSPNEDGTNDLFKITGLQNWPDHRLYVYNRWGNLIFEAQNYQSDWDGIWNGKKVPDGTYYYVLDLGNGKKPVTGYLQIMR